MGVILAGHLLMMVVVVVDQQRRLVECVGQVVVSVQVVLLHVLNVVVD